MKKMPTPAEALNGISLDNINISHDGELEVTFDLPCEQDNNHWDTDLQGTRSFDLDEEDDLSKVCRELFHLLRKRIQEPDPEREKVDCDHCATSACCREYNVLINDSDVERLANHLQLTPDEVKKRYTDKGMDWTGDYPYQLRKDEDDEETEKCVFLKEDEVGRWRCSVYLHRPQICRDYAMKSCDLFTAIEEAQYADKA